MMRKNPYLTQETQTTVFGVVGQGLVGIGLMLPPPFNFIVTGVGLVSTSIGFVMAKDRTTKE